MPPISPGPQAEKTVFETMAGMCGIVGAIASRDVVPILTED
jgi:hypothetical protein